MAPRWTLGKDWTVVSSVRGLISCCFPSTRSSSPPPDSNKKDYGTNGQSVKAVDERGSTLSVISCGSHGSGRRKKRKNSGLDGGDSGVISEGLEAGSPQGPGGRTKRHSQGILLHSFFLLPHVVCRLVLASVLCGLMTSCSRTWQHSGHCVI